MDDIEPQHKMIKDSPLGTIIHVKFEVSQYESKLQRYPSFFFLHRPVVYTLLRCKNGSQVIN